MKRKKAARRRSANHAKRPVYAMKLYVTGATPRSSRAINNLRRLCEEHLPGQYELEVIDVYQQPALAREGQIVAIPTLVKTMPMPLRKFIGDMSDTGNLLAGLEVNSG